MFKKLKIFLLCFFLLLPFASNALWVNYDISGLDIAKGDRTGYSVWRGFGRNDVVSGNEEETLWTQGGKYEYLTASSNLFLTSSSTTDTANVLIKAYGLDEDWNYATASVSLNGRTVVTLNSGSTTNTWYRLFKIELFQSDNTTSNAGKIYVNTSRFVSTNGVPTSNIKAVIEIGENESAMGLYTIPSGKEGYLLKKTMSAGKALTDTVLTYMKRPMNREFSSSNKWDLARQQETIVNAIPETLPERTDIEFRGKAATTVGMGIEFEILLID